VKDRVFSGADVEEAVASAAANLGLPRAELRYVVLEAGSPGGRGLKATPARIAVLVEEARRHAPAGLAREDRPAERAPASARDPLEGLRETVRAIARGGGLDVAAAIDASEEAVLVRLEGPDAAFFVGADGRGEPLRAAEHLLHRLYGAALQPRALRVSAEGFRERRDEAIAEEARRLAAEVRRDGQARTLAPQNAYERRVVHVALQGEPGVLTHSVGEGASRRVTISPAPGAEASDAGE
jgi:spoIIIJ-associated protein